MAIHLADSESQKFREIGFSLFILDPHYRLFREIDP